MTSYGVRRSLVLVALVLAMIGTTALAVLASIWFLTPLPLLAAGTYAVLLGMTPGRFFDALDDPTSGSGTQLPF